MPAAQSSEPHAEPEKDLRRPVLYALLAFALVVGVVAVVLLRQDGKAAEDAAGQSSQQPSSESGPSSAVSATTPPTEPTASGEPTASATAPSASSSAPVTPAPNPPSDVAQTPEAAPSSVSVLVTSHSYDAAKSAIVVVGAVQGEATQTSTCTAVATLNGVAATASVAGVFDGNATSCGTIEVPMAGQASGVWTVVIKFEYAGGLSTSAPVQVSIPG